MNINPFDILKNAQKLQEEMGSFQEKLSAISVTGSAGGGMTEIDMNGKMEVLAVRIAEEVAGEEDTEMLQDLIAAAFNNAMEKIREAIAQEMGGMIPGGLQGLAGFPGGFPQGGSR
ncbi:MAG: YbaB/EbfC family nucleoid-associated protein [Treponema sp.]|nr:YbaB/EbfC family nucleoid-associated protein [Treponema sp.]